MTAPERPLAEMRKAMATLGMRDVSHGGMLHLVMSATGPAHPDQLRHRAVCHRISPSGSASPRIDNHAGIVRPGGGGQASPEVDADPVVPVGENLGDQVTEAHRLTPPHTSGLGSWLSTSGCGSATRKADAALPRSGRGPIHVPGWRVDGN